MAKQSAGILVYRRKKQQLEVFLVHLDGPFWAKKDMWSFPKGELKDDEDHLAAARREFQEETSLEPPTGEYIELGSSKSSSKTDYIWAVESDLDEKKFRCSSMVKLEWPPKSDQFQEFPEVDKAGWFTLEKAKTKLFKNQIIFIDRLTEVLQLAVEPVVSSEQSSLF